MSVSLSVYSVLLVSVFCFSFGSVFGQQCNDCQLVRDCPEAKKLVARNDPPSQKLLRGAFCGFQNMEPKVCCSAVGDESLDSHPNLYLLTRRDNCGVINLERFFGGTNAGLNSFPWITLISFKIGGNLTFGCAGTLINERYVLTAAQCIKGYEIAGVRVGDYDLQSKIDCEMDRCEDNIQDLRVEQSIIHPEHKINQKEFLSLNDIGLLRLEKDVDTSYRNAKPVCLPITSNLRMRPIYGETAALAGWGISPRYDYRLSQTLQTVDLPIHTAEDCRSRFNRKNHSSVKDTTLNKICAGTVGKGTCVSDPGGPLMLPGTYRSKLRYIQYGIFSYGPILCSVGPGVYTDVSKYMKWILDTIRP